MTGPSASQPAYGIGALARRLGIAPATLRDWERRYGIGPSGRTAGGHRRYQADDIARIEHMHRLILDGVPPAEAARATAATAAAAAGSPGTAPAAAGGPATAAPPAPAGQAEPGPRSLALQDQLPQARGLARAALALESAAIIRTLRSSLAERGAAATWELLAVPVLIDIGERHAATGACVEIEHLLSAQLQAVLADRAARVYAPRNSRPVLLACADEEQHSLALYALAATLADLRVRTLMLGARTPPAALADAISRTGPAAALVWSQTTATADPDQLGNIPGQRPALRLFAAGPGWRAAPPGAGLVTTLPEAVRQSCEAAGVR